MELQDLVRELDAIDWAAGRLGYNVREVKDRTDKIRIALGARPYAPDVRQYVINLRGWDMPPQFATSAWLDSQLERLIDGLASDAERAELNELAAR